MKQPQHSLTLSYWISLHKDVLKLSTLSICHYHLFPSCRHFFPGLQKWVYLVLPWHLSPVLWATVKVTFVKYKCYHYDLCPQLSLICFQWLPSFLWIKMPPPRHVLQGSTWSSPTYISSSIFYHTLPHTLCSATLPIFSSRLFKYSPILQRSLHILNPPPVSSLVDSDLWVGVTSLHQAVCLTCVTLARKASPVP